MKVNKFLLVIGCVIGTSSLPAFAKVDLLLKISGESLKIEKKIKIDEPLSPDSITEFDFISHTASRYRFKLEYKFLPLNRSYPNNLDITISDAEGNKLGYLFFALNDLSFLEKIGRFGLRVKTPDGVIDFEFLSKQPSQGNLNFSILDSERFIQDTLLESKGFQMIRPVILSSQNMVVRRKEFQLDNYPYSVEFLSKKLIEKRIEFSHNLYKLEESREKSLVLSVYFQANTLKDLREVMFAAKHFRIPEGPAKIVFYPAMGQLEPRR